MRPRHFLSVLFAVLLFLSPAGMPQAQNSPQVAHYILSAPAGNRPTKIDPTGVTVLPSGRLITPLGRQVKVAPHPYGLALSPDGKTLVTVNSGTRPFSVSIVTGLASEQPQVAQIPPALVRTMTIRRASFWVRPLPRIIAPSTFPRATTGRLAFSI